VERLRSWSFIENPYKSVLGQGIGTRRCPKGMGLYRGKHAEFGKKKGRGDNQPCLCILMVLLYWFIKLLFPE
jgi:hypothetical protein